MILGGDSGPQLLVQKHLCTHFYLFIKWRLLIISSQNATKIFFKPFGCVHVSD